MKSRVKQLKEKQAQLLADNKDEEVKRHPVKPIQDRIDNLERQLKGREDELDAINRHTAECNEALKAYDDLANDVQQYVEDNTNDLRAKKELPPKDQLAEIEKKKREYNRPPECYRVMKEKEEECRKIGTDTDSFGPINSIWAEYGKYLDRKEAKLKDDEERKKNESLSPEEEALLEKVYNALNQDGQGLTVDQLREALQAMGINMSLNDIMAKLQAMGYEVTPGLQPGPAGLQEVPAGAEGDEEQQGGHPELVEVPGEGQRQDQRSGRGQVLQGVQELSLPEGEYACGRERYV